ncbi:MAG TPA: hypothetical protein VK817_11885 [Trebonia sp.]|jgi:hypothetical protein|nr:hypothetical protein [Trebonia sp.]
MDNPNDSDDEVSIDPFPGVKIPEWLVRAVGPRLTGRGRIPAAIFSAGRSFGALWTLTVNPGFDDIGSYTLLPCVELGGKWYVGAGPAAGGS